jgi:diol dehydratase reactivase alpha subunit
MEVVRISIAEAPIQRCIGHQERNVIGHLPGTACFYDEPLPAEVFARVVVLGEDGGMAPIPTRHGLERIRQVRRDAKHRVFVVNSLRALEQVAPKGSMRTIDFVVLLGGSALDFEIPEMISAALAEHGIVCGTGNVRGSEGPRNAVATGLVSCFAADGG